MLVLSIDLRVAEPATLADLGRRQADLHARLQHEPSVRGVVVVATCARIEAYVDASTFHGPHSAFIESLAVDAALVRSHRGRDGLEHLFRVTCGLESAVVGEAQVAGQVRDALLSARARGTTTRTLDLAFENAMRVSRAARATGGAQPSSVGVALDTLNAERHSAMGTALVIGTGAFAQACVAELRVRGAHTIWSHSPSGREQIPEGADHAIDAEELASALALSDVTMSASGHGPDVITEAIAREAIVLRSTPLVLVDLAASGDIAAALDDDPDVHVLRLADITRSTRAASAAGTLVRNEARILYPRIEDGELDDLIVRLRTHVHDVARAELGSTPEPGAVKAVRRITQALLHDPTERARAAAARGELERYRAALEMVFGLEAVEAREEGNAA